MKLDDAQISLSSVATQGTQKHFEILTEVLAAFEASLQEVALELKKKTAQHNRTAYTLFFI